MEYMTAVSLNDRLKIHVFFTCDRYFNILFKINVPISLKERNERGERERKRGKEREGVRKSGYPVNYDFYKKHLH